MKSKHRKQTELKSITEFFGLYGLGIPLFPDIMAMKLEDQPSNKLVNMPLYRADFFRIIYFKNAALKFSVGDARFSIPKNCLCYTYPGKLESWSRRGRLMGYVIYFSPPFAGIDITAKTFVIKYPFFASTAYPFIRLNVSDAKKFESLAAQIIFELNSNQPDNREMVKNLLTLVLHFMRRKYIERQGAPDPNQTSLESRLYQFKNKIDELIHASESHKSGKPLSVSDMAKNLHVSAGYLNKVIKSTTGKTASLYIHEKLIFEAKSYLSNTDLKVNEIAYILGFDDHSYFSRFFKKLTGYTPAGYRNHNAGQR